MIDLPPVDHDRPSRSGHLLHQLFGGPPLFLKAWSLLLLPIISPRRDWLKLEEKVADICRLLNGVSPNTRSIILQEAKRESTPSLPSDMQSVLRRCVNLEKELRSLKLNFSFMNRKDSEQTKQIEELQKWNEELTNEKERLLDEIDRIISNSG